MRAPPSLTLQESTLKSLVRSDGTCCGPKQSKLWALLTMGFEDVLPGDWEWPYMYALADTGFELARGSRICPCTLRVLEIGWGEGISGRRLLAQPALTGAAQHGVEVQYEVIELHPVVAQDALKEAKKHPHGRMLVHEGPWQQVFPRLPAGQYDLIFHDPYNLTPRDMGEPQRFETWGMPLTLLDNLLFYRLLRPGGVVVQYAISHGPSTATDLLRRYVAPLYTDFQLRRVDVGRYGIQPESGNRYATTHQARSLEVPALIK
eukprot:TRINITY_DN10982_c0_g1_i2.p1 TRINITY_DN10982_c0_g1~~TRINITY_DN10982_c0_g1_i2.p1  ORF type:complete len:262 (-),score=31.20 TRINITY_DN10982_c0_g1_i2:488-1273(-)